MPTTENFLQILETTKNYLHLNICGACKRTIGRMVHKLIEWLTMSIRCRRECLIVLWLSCDSLVYLICLGGVDAGDRSGTNVQVVDARPERICVATEHWPQPRSGLRHSFLLDTETLHRSKSSYIGTAIAETDLSKFTRACIMIIQNNFFWNASQWP